MRFLDREAELALLREHLLREGPALLVLYGRRRIGKTELVRKAIEESPKAAYHVATRSTIADEMERLSQALAQAWAVPLLHAQPLRSTAALLAFLESVPEPGTLVLDEFPYLVESDPSLPGSLQASWDRRLSKTGIKLLVCGSSMAMMEETFLSRRSPLFGRRTGQLRLGPLGAHDLATAFGRGPADTVELAAVFGGVPGYLGRLDPHRSLRWNIRHRLLARGEPLYEEVPFLLREELREPRVYHAVLAAIARGATKFGEISSKVGLDRANLTRYLAVLGDLGLVEREIPITEPRPEKSRKGLYRIADAFLASWFRFVHPNLDLLERDLGDEVMAHRVGPELASFLPRAVEPVIRDLVVRSPLADALPFPAAHVGRYWSPAAEFDLVLLDAARRSAFVAEIKWTRRGPGLSPLDDLRRRVAGEEAFRRMNVRFGIVSRERVPPARRVRADETVIDFSALRW